MLTKCANPACDANLHYLSEGKIFRIDTESLAYANRRAKPSVSTTSAPPGDCREISSLSVVADRGGAHRPEYFWLCAGCSLDWTIAVHNGSVVVKPIKPLVQCAVAS